MEEEIIAHLKLYVQHYRKQNLLLATVMSELYQQVYSWLEQQKLDPITFLPSEITGLVLSALYEARVVVS